MTFKASSLAILVGLMMLTGVSNADIKADMNAGLPLIEVLKNALKGGMKIKDAVAETIAMDPENAGNVVAAAINLVPSLSNISNNANAIARIEAEISQAAIATGLVDPQTVTAATAAGRAGFVTLPGLDRAKDRSGLDLPIKGGQGGASPS